MFGWKSSPTPREKMLGRQIYDGGVIGGQLIPVNEKNVEVAAVSDEFLRTSNDQYEAKVEATIKQVTAEVGGKLVNTEKLSASGVRVLQIIDFTTGAKVDQRFVYQCLTAQRYQFDLAKQAGGSVGVDASALANKLGVDAAKVEFKASPDNPDTVRVVVNNPDVCLAYVPVRFVDASSKWWGCSVASKTVTFHNVANAASFSLAPGQVSNWHSAEFCGKEPVGEPWYRLQAKRDAPGAAPYLEVCMKERGLTESATSCKRVDDLDGTPVHVKTYPYEERLYKAVSLNVKGSVSGDKIEIHRAYLTYPEYELLFD
jgi:hypothetical protein